MKSFLQLKFIPLNPSLALLILRVWLGGSMLALHGWGKLQKLVKGDFSFGDPLHIGAAPTLVLAVTAEGTNAAAVVGLTRGAALELRELLAAQP